MTDAMEDWPREGDKLFSSDLPDRQHNLGIGPAFDDIGSWYRYLIGYREAADRVAQSLRDELGCGARGPLVTLIFPVVFLYRHHFELALKAIIRIGARIYDEDDQIPPHHKLADLWTRARPILESWGQGGEPVDVTEELLREIDELDLRSFCFRYPEATNGTASLPDSMHFNIRNLAEVAGKIGDFLTCCAEGLWNDLADKETYLSDMGAMCRDEEGWVEW